MSFQNADLIFLGTGQGELDQSIVESTAGSKKLNYSHVAIVKVDADGQVTIIEASPKGGVQATDWENYRQNRQEAISLYRFKEPVARPEAVIAKAEAKLGKPYNKSFYPDDPGYYCSELVLEAFAGQKDFKTIPMRFGPRGTVLPSWQTYFDKLGKSVPNGVAGSNPNNLIEQGLLEFVEQVQ
ncbi:YiiX/YebB-like N1pC/P60 family cysteine hydrolase [Eupransor demetentiae]|uniref:NlpC/P60 family (YycO) n=1 Tax=Eupransor demetentiae TaxID=3109584 RepID=A0ABM9N4I3_9LACO|nr:NlpC/P60 family (YycO) [Lactobacillaceae bacterium LMG 33000]